MGYDLHITRKDHFFDDAPEITLDEWLAFVAHDLEMRHDGFAEAVVGDGQTLRVEAPGISVWTAYSGSEDGKQTAWMRWSSGNIVVKNPDHEIRQKMWRIAQGLGAKVQGEGAGELYGEDGEMIEVTKPLSASASCTQTIGAKRSWWRFW